MRLGQDHYRERCEDVGPAHARRPPRRAASAPARRRPRAVRPQGLPQHDDARDRRERRRHRVPALPPLRVEGRDCSARRSLFRSRASSTSSRRTWQSVVPEETDEDELARHFVEQLYDVFVEHRGLAADAGRIGGVQRGGDRRRGHRRHQASVTGARSDQRRGHAVAGHALEPVRTCPRIRRWR